MNFYDGLMAASIWEKAYYLSTWLFILLVILYGIFAYLDKGGPASSRTKLVLYISLIYFVIIFIIGFIWCFFGKCPYGVY